MKYFSWHSIRRRRKQGRDKNNISQILLLSFWSFPFFLLFMSNVTMNCCSTKNTSKYNNFFKRRKNVFFLLLKCSSQTTLCCANIMIVIEKELPPTICKRWENLHKSYINLISAAPYWKPCRMWNILLHIHILRSKISSYRLRGKNMDFIVTAKMFNN